jgi:hypothetical protein
LSVLRSSGIFLFLLEVAGCGGWAFGGVISVNSKMKIEETARAHSSDYKLFMLLA